jgi:PHD/YefM family antitoxin component YafN of YafNO toxin-antitoxin module
METMYLLSSKANADHLRESILQYQEGKYIKVDMSDLEKLEK